MRRKSETFGGKLDKDSIEPDDNKFKSNNQRVFLPYLNVKNGAP